MLRSVVINSLVGGFKHFLFPIIYGMSSFPLTNSIIFQDGFFNHQPVVYHVQMIWLCSLHKADLFLKFYRLFHLIAATGVSQILIQTHVVASTLYAS